MLSKRVFNLFPLWDNSKNPMVSWTNPANWNPPTIGTNYGVVTGKPSQITVVDLDCYKKSWLEEKPHPFIEKFGSDYIEKFNTYTVESASGGIHLYFNYDEDIRSTNNPDFEIDIKNDGNYIVGPGSMLDGESYKVKLKKKIKSMPPTLKTWLLNNLYKKTVKSLKEGKISRDKGIKSSFKYFIPRDDIELIIRQLPVKYRTDYDSWLKFTTFCKILDVQDLWDNYSKQDSSYDPIKNQNVWNGISNGMNYSIVEFILNETNMLDKLPYYRLKQIPEDSIKPKITKYLNNQKLGYDFLTPDFNYVIKSDTGTGKTTSFKHYIKSQGNKFISICSRVSLCEEQYKVFSKHNVDCVLYSHQEFALNKEDSIVIQVDSIRRLTNFNFSNRIIFMDEFNSIVDYLITSPTLRKQRVNILRLLLRIFREAKQVICVDADISDICFKILDHVELKYEYYINEYQHNKGISAFELPDKKTLLEKLSKEDKFLLCCDSKTEAIYVYEELSKGNPNKKYKIITGDTTEQIDLDADECVIFSPKIIYGLDSIMSRPVYCLYKSETISPKHMVQQINRCRNITEIYYYFIAKTVYEPFYTSFEDCKEILKTRDSIEVSEFVESANDIENRLYFDLFASCEYLNDCFNTNKFLHFKQIIRSRGITDKDLFYNSKKDFASTKGQLQYKRDGFDVDSKRVESINSYLQVPTNEIENYIDYFVDDFKLQNHFAISAYFFKEKQEFEDSISSIREFKVSFITSDDSKIIFLRNISNACGLRLNDNNKLVATNLLTDEQNTKFLETYKTIWNDRSKALDFRDQSKLLSKIYLIYKQLFGTFFINQKKSNGTVNYYVNKKQYQKEQELFTFRNFVLPDKCLLD